MTLPAGFSVDRLADALRVADALKLKQIVTLDEVVAATELDAARVRSILRELSRAGLVTMHVMSSGNCEGRKDGPQFFYSRTPAFEAAVVAARQV